MREALVYAYARMTDGLTVEARLDVDAALDGLPLPSVVAAEREADAANAAALHELTGGVL